MKPPNITLDELLASTTSFFEAYPFPAFLLRVRAPGSFVGRDFVATKARTAIVAEDKATKDDYATPAAVAGSSTSSTTYTFPGEQPLPENVHHRHLMLPVLEPPTAPISSPGALTMMVAWSNAHWQALTGDEPLPELMDRHQFSTLQAWAERNAERDARTVFSLQLARPKIRLDLVKTRIPAELDTPESYIMVTSMGIDEDQEAPPRSQPLPKTPPDLPENKIFERPVEKPVELGLVVDELERKKLQSTALHGRLRKEFTGTRQSSIPQCHLLLDEFDWSKTSAGPRSGWPPEINVAISLVFSSIHQDSVWVGKDMHVIYSNSSIGMVNHPHAFGAPIREIWGAFWSTLGPMVERAAAGEPVVHESDLMLFYHKDTDRYIEHYHAASLIPIFDQTNRVVAIHNVTSDHTARVLAQRRLETTHKLVEQAGFARSSDEFYQSVADVFQQNPADAPFMMFYSVNEVQSKSESIPIQSLVPKTFDVNLKLESSVGVPKGHASAPGTQQLTLTRTGGLQNHTRSRVVKSEALSGVLPSGARGYKTGSWGHDGDDPKSKVQCVTWPIAQALETRQSVIVENISDLIKDYPIRHWEILPDTAVVIPIASKVGSEATPPAVLILGLNIYRPLDSEYDDWIQQIRGHLVSSLVSVQALETEIRRRVARDRLELAQRAWFRGAAHEFRSPLTLISGPLEDIAQTSLSDRQRHLLRISQSNVSRLSQLVASFLDFTRMEAGKVTANFLPIDLPAFVSDVSSWFAPALHRLGIAFEVKVEPRDTKVILDPILVEMVISNLLSNALKFTHKGLVALELSFDDFANISVTDTGPGIPAGEIEIVTDWFQRSKTVANTTVEGTGVGLALIKEIVKLHEGELLIISHQVEDDSHHNRGEDEGRGHGSTLKVRFPLSHVHKSTTESFLVPTVGSYGKKMATEMEHWADTGSDTSDADSTTGKNWRSQGLHSIDGLCFERSDKLLIVDDDREVLAYLGGTFEPYCTVLLASSADEALRLVETDRPDLVLTDVLMRRKTGLELLEEIKNNPATALIPVVCCSAAVDDGLREAALVGNADDWIAKPFKPRELVVRVHLHMQMGKKRANLERLFTQRELELTTLSDYCPSGILRTDATGKIVYANHSFREPAGIAGDANIDCWWANVDPEGRPAIEAAWTQIVHGDQTPIKLQWKWSAGKTMSGVFIRLDKVRPGLSGIIGCINDISYQEEKVKEAERRQKEAEESRRQQELLVDLTSHEIRTPVSAILQCSSVVKENLSALTDQLRFSGPNGFHPPSKLFDELESDIEALESIYQCGLVQERIAGDILSFARLQLNMLTLHDVDFDLQRELHKLVSIFSSEARSKNINIRLILGTTLSQLQITRIKTDPVRFGQVVTNLISNALRFTSGSDVRHIVLRVDAAWAPPIIQAGLYAEPTAITTVRNLPAPTNTPVFIYASVTDTGPGMKQSEMDGLFQRFHQGNMMIHTQYGGSGLGLFICKKITGLLGGDIRVKSEPGKGSTLSFFTKALIGAPSSSRPAQARAASSTSAHSPLLVTPAMEPGELPRPNLHILVVEDNVINQTVLKRQLQKAGLTCEVADNGQIALNMVHSVHERASQGDGSGLFDMILMDVEMPVMDGLTATRLLREAEDAGVGPLPRQIIIALTGNARQGQINAALAAGMDDVVIKPYRFADLLAKINQADSQRRQGKGDGGLRFDPGPVERGSKAEPM